MIMHGLVSLLDDVHYSIVVNLWKELEEKFELTGIKVTPFPHFSWQVAEDYNVDKIEDLMRETAKELKPFKIRTTGLGIFAGENPVLYITVSIDKTLLSFHEMIFNKFSVITKGALEYYNPGIWVPHISLAYTDLNQENIGDVISFLSFQDYHWEIDIDNIAFIYEPNGMIGDLRYRIKLG
jgi:2'-5' RNA ligase